MKDLKEIDFTFWTPISLKKSKANKAENELVRVGGVAATEAVDYEGEVLLMKGMDISYLESGKGVFNWNHKDGPGDILGRIDVAKKDNTELYVEGYLYKGVEKAIQCHDLMKAMDSTPNPADQMGFSVEGKILQRSNGRIQKSWINSVAITHEPVNHTTTAGLLKSLGGKEVCFGDDGEPCACKIDKALSAGHDVSPKTGGGALRRESLEGGTKNTKNKKKKKKESARYADGRGAYKSLRDQLNKAIDRVLEMRPNLSRREAAQVVSFTLARKLK